MLLMEEMRYLKKEVFKVILLNTKNHIIKYLNVSVKPECFVVHPREVFNEGGQGGLFRHAACPQPSQWRSGTQQGGYTNDTQAGKCRQYTGDQGPRSCDHRGREVRKSKGAGTDVGVSHGPVLQKALGG